MALYEQPWQLADAAASPPTPLVRSRVPALSGAWLKVEGQNPSGSFKDRVMRVLVREAIEVGARGAVVASSGNAAVAAAAACAREGLPLLVLVPDAVSPAAVAMVRLRGGAVVRAGEGPAAVHGLASRLATAFGLPNLASTFGAAGCEWACRGIGHEVHAQLGSQRVVRLAASISVGPVLLGAGTGLAEAGRPPIELVAGQAAGCAPIARAFDEGADEVLPWTGPAPTAALAIADRLTGYADEASYALGRIRASGGVVGAATDEEMLLMREAFARYDGLDVELASCAAPAVLARLGLADPETVCVLTGAGTKETLSRPTEDASTDGEPSVGSFAERAGTGPALVEEVTAWVHSSRS
ncbi:pyridoxal-phosphate dependent enzyme [Blastococcus atacamensis]|uniref:pyridoxal-phosphate dependent enzyme n=1 Tax=Blastococcus atacamensis TaxID=2070508 RepID=UPI001300004C|nr:pyridoxal-phosphate dependent enzyme [Blastococcus atacamensis]